MIDEVSGCFEEVFDTFPREEPEMRLVEQTRLAVAELATEKGEAHTSVRDVRDRSDNHAITGDKRTDSLQDSARILEVLKHIGEEHRFELLAVELRHKIKRLSVAHDDSLAILACRLRCLWYQFDTRNFAVQVIAKYLRHVSGSRSELEDSRTAGDEIDHEAVR